MDKRQGRRLVNKARKAERRINTVIWKRMKELLKDKQFIKTVDQELKNINTREEYNAYINNASEYAKRDATRQMAT